ncbi:MAG: DUF371 domain-containing protein [Thermoprotei archaeon]|nr:MAG: DUF371 domain-containing protein [Thermoprotei archaeon]
MIAADIVRARGHPNVRATHQSTLEVTKEAFLTPRGDCIIGVSANKAAADLNDLLKSVLKNDESLVLVVIRVENLFTSVVARGSQVLLLTSGTSMVIRKSTYIDDRTIAIKSDKAAIDIPRHITRKLRENSPLELTIIAASPPHTELLGELVNKPLTAWILGRSLVFGRTELKRRSISRVYR